MDVKTNDEDIVEPKKLVAFEISDGLRQKIREDAFKNDLSFSAMIRLILNRYYLDKENSDKNV